jgi:hypothetical protein
MANLHRGDCSFLLQDFYVLEHADNFMMHLIVTDVDAWWRHVEAKGIASKSGELVGISEGGAMIGCESGMKVGEKGSLRLSDLSSALPFVVRAHEGEAIHVEFHFAKAQAASLQEWLNRHIPTTSALAS